MKKLIVTADDFGFNAKINKGIIEAHKNGVVTSVGLFSSHESFPEAVNLLKDNPGLAVGLHLDLDRFFVIDHKQGVVSGWDISSSLLADIRSETRRQIDILKNAGIEPDHVSSHHCTHMIEEVLSAVAEVAKEYGIGAIRLKEKFYPENSQFERVKEILRQNKIITTEHSIEGWYWGNIDEDFTTAELVTHPGYGELWREYELVACCDSNLKGYLKEQAIELTAYKELLTG